MEAVAETRAIGQSVAEVDAAVTALAEQSGSLASDRELLDGLLAATRVEARLHAWRTRVAARLEAGEAAWREHGTSVSTWLADVANLTRREASRLVRHGHELERFGTVAAAAASGVVLPEQAEAITGVLQSCPTT